MQELDDMGFEIVNTMPCFDGNAVEQTRLKGLIQVKTLYWLSGEGVLYQKTFIPPFLDKEQLTALDKALNKK